MLVVVTSGQHQIYVDGYYNTVLTDIREKALTHKWDAVALCTGLEGSGKTTFSAQSCAVIDSNFSLAQVAFCPEQVKEIAIDLDLPKGSSILWDESASGSQGKDFMTKINKDLQKVFMQIRSKGYYIMIILPDFFDLTKYYAVHRSLYLVHVFAKSFTERGYFRFYSRERKRDLYRIGKTSWDMNCVAENFWGRFSKYLPYSEEEYEAKKQAAIKKYYSAEEDKKDAKTIKLMQYIAGCAIRAKNYNLTLSQIGAILDRNPDYIRKLARYTQEKERFKEV